MWDNGTSTTEGDNVPHIPNSHGPGKHSGKRPVGHRVLGGNHRKDGCCSYERAAVSLLRGKGRLAVRYIRMDIKARLGLIQGRTA